VAEPQTKGPANRRQEILQMTMEDNWLRRPRTWIEMFVLLNGKAQHLE